MTLRSEIAALDTGMTSTAAAITAFADKVATGIPTGHTGSGEPCIRARKVIAGTVVEVWVIGYNAERTEVTLPYISGTKVLTVAEAAEAAITAAS